MKVFAIGSGNAPLTPEQRQQYMPSEVPAISTGRCNSLMKYFSRTLEAQCLPRSLV